MGFAFQEMLQEINGAQGLRAISAKAKEELPVKVMMLKAGEAGVPTNLDWDGCVGTVQILLQK